MNIVCYENAKQDKKVKRGPGWDWGHQDCDNFNNPTTGKLIVNSRYPYLGGYTAEAEVQYYWVQVEWSNGEVNSYRIPKNEKSSFLSDLVYVEAQLTFDFD